MMTFLLLWAVRSNGVVEQQEVLNYFVCFRTGDRLSLYSAQMICSKQKDATKQQQLGISQSVKLYDAKSSGFCFARFAFARVSDSRLNVTKPTQTTRFTNLNFTFLPEIRSKVVLGRASKTRLLLLLRSFERSFLLSKDKKFVSRLRRRQWRHNYVHACSVTLLSLSLSLSLSRRRFLSSHYILLLSLSFKCFVSQHALSLAVSLSTSKVSNYLFLITCNTYTKYLPPTYAPPLALSYRL